MFTQPYRTTALRAWDRDNVLQGALERAYIEEELKAVEDGQYPTDIYAVMPGTRDIEQLWAPVIIKTRAGIKCVFDARNCARLDRDGSIVINQPLDYNFLYRESALTYIWNEDGPKAFSGIKEHGMRVFSRWFSEGLGYRYGLEINEQIMLGVLAAYYFQCLFVEANDAPELQMGTISYISRVLNTPIERVNQILNGDPHYKAPYFADLASFCEYVRQVGGPRLEVFTPAHIYNAVNNNWFGGRARTIIPCALEFPPTFFTMLYTAYTDRSYHRCYFTKIAEEADRSRRLRDAFTKALTRVSRGMIHV